jgi:hypothetical protein
MARMHSVRAGRAVKARGGFTGGSGAGRGICLRRDDFLPTENSFAYASLFL